MKGYMKIINNTEGKKGDLKIEKAIAKQIAKGVDSGVIETNESTFIWELNVSYN